VVSGVVLKEWQRTPKKLVEEWCQKQKRPRPQYRLAGPQKEGSGKTKQMGSSRGGGGVRSWLTLPDPKDPTKSLKFLTDQRFAEQLEAEHASALLALLHLGPELPRERVLPEPFRSMWLQLTGRQGQSKEGQAEQEGPRKKGGKKVAAWRVAEEEAKALKEAEALQEQALQEQGKTRTRANRSGQEETPPDPRVPAGSAQRGPVVDPEAVVELSSSLKFASVKEKEQFHRDRAEQQARRQQSKQVKELTNPDVTCYMEEHHRVTVERLLRQAASERSIMQQAGSGGEASTEEGEGEPWEGVRRQLLRSGFSEEQADLARQALPPPLTPASCLDWLCLHLPESELPPALTVKGKHLEVRSGSIAQKEKESSPSTRTFSSALGIDGEDEEAPLGGAEESLFSEGFTVLLLLASRSCSAPL